MVTNVMGGSSQAGIGMVTQAAQDEGSDTKGAEERGTGQGSPAPNCPVDGSNEGEGANEPYVATTKLNEELQGPGTEGLELYDSDLSLGVLCGWEK